jgi:beta-mannosidase
VNTPIVVTGAAGFIGRNIVAALNARGLTNLVLVDRLGTDGQWRNRRGLEFKDVITPEAFLALVEAGCAPPATRAPSPCSKKACAITCRAPGVGSELTVGLPCRQESPFASHGTLCLAQAAGFAPECATPPPAQARAISMRTAIPSGAADRSDLPSALFPLRQTIPLDGSWSFAWSEHAAEMRTIAEVQQSGHEARPCQVPGNFELDLQANGLIAEPFFGMNIAALRRYESAHIWYFRRFDCAVTEGATPVLVFEGLDCFADVWLNGRHVGSSANALVEQIFPAEELRATGNDLLVHLRPVADEVRRFAFPPGAVPQRYSYESLYARKAPHVFGWDIMPRAVSAGIWRPVRLEFLPPARLDTVWLETTAADEREAQLTLHFRTRLPAGDLSGYEIALRGACGDSHFEAHAPILFEAGRIPLAVKNPLRWWPRDRGEPALYAVEVRLIKEGRDCDRAVFRHGIRTVELRRTSLTDDAGHGEFCFLINGERVFVRGTNWVPADAYHSRDAARLPRMLALAEECGCNMIRCWGGNVYESAEFFAFCDEHGIMVWQDFALACAVYPQDDSLGRALEVEARKVVRRLRQHPSLVLWAGDNECDLAYDWFHRGSPEQNRWTRELLPRVLADEDPSRPYLPSSPYVDAQAVSADRRYLPETHLWGPRDYFKSPFYADSLCHFASEIGYHGCPSARSVRRFLSPGKLWPPGNAEWLLHATSPIPGVDLWDYRALVMSKQIREMFGAEPDNLDDFARQSQCVQAEADKYFIELFRGAKWRRTGLIWWNLIDGWPQFSDAVVDYYFEKKLAFDFIRRAQQPLLVMLREVRNRPPELVVCNDRRAPTTVRYVVRDIDVDQPLLHGEHVAAGDAVTLLDTLPVEDGRRRFLVIDWETPDARGRNHHLMGTPPFDAVQYQLWLERAYSPREHSK